MSLTHYLAMAVILLVAGYFFALGFIALIKPSLAARFLLGFAQNIVVHYCELLLRLIVGFALLHQSATMRFTNVIELFAWILIFSTMALFLLPWRWHRQFAQKVVPYANRYLSVIGVISLALGISVIVALNASAHTSMLAPQASHSSPSALDDYITLGMQRTQAQGLAIAIIENGKVTRVSSWGKRNAQGDTLDTNTIMYGA